MGQGTLREAETLEGRTLELWARGQLFTKSFDGAVLEMLECRIAGPGSLSSPGGNGFSRLAPAL